MKKVKIISVLLLGTLLISSTMAFASDTLDAAKRNFTTYFSKAKEVKWISGEDYYRVSFKMNSYKMSAYFDENAKLLYTTKIISDADLSYTIMRKLIKRYPDQKINNAVECQSNQGTMYYITLESASDITVLFYGPGNSLTKLHHFTKQQ